MAKFKVGDKVTVADQEGTISEVGVHDQHWLLENPQLYGVRLKPWAKIEEHYVNAGGQNKTRVSYLGPNGEKREHECDTLGCVPESEIEAV